MAWNHTTGAFARWLLPTALLLVNAAALAGPPCSESEPAVRGEGVAAWTRRLESPSVDDRISAWAALEVFGEDAVAAAPLVAALAQDSDPALRARAIEVLGAIGSASHAEVVAAYLRDAVPGVRSAAGWALRNMPVRMKPGLDLLIEGATGDLDEDVRIAFVACLDVFAGNLTPTETSKVRALVRGMLLDQSAQVRKLCVDRLHIWGIKDDEVAASLSEMLASRDATMRLAAAVALMAMGRQSAAAESLVAASLDGADDLAQAALWYSDNSAELRRKLLKKCCSVLKGSARQRLRLMIVHWMWRHAAMAKESCECLSAVLGGRDKTVAREAALVLLRHCVLPAGAREELGFDAMGSVDLLVRGRRAKMSNAFAEQDYPAFARMAGAEDESAKIFCIGVLDAVGIREEWAVRLLAKLRYCDSDMGVRRLAGEALVGLSRPR
jgi:HEAT repeat protein